MVVMVVFGLQFACGGGTRVWDGGNIRVVGSRDCGDCD